MVCGIASSLGELTLWPSWAEFVLPVLAWGSSGLPIFIQHAKKIACWSTAIGDPPKTFRFSVSQPGTLYKWRSYSMLKHFFLHFIALLKLSCSLSQCVLSYSSTVDSLLNKWWWSSLFFFFFALGFTFKKSVKKISQNSQIQQTLSLFQYIFIFLTWHQLSPASMRKIIHWICVGRQ